MKKVLALLLTLALLAGLAVPAMAADDADARLTAVTQTVKTKLALDTSAYIAFAGDAVQSALGSTWYLIWSSDTGSLQIEAMEDGTILSYDCTVPYYDPNDSGFPTYPDGDIAAATAAAQAFLDKALNAGESVKLTAPETRQGSLNQTSCSFEGCILINGLPSEFYYYLRVDAATGQITYFYRDTSPMSYMGEIPSAYTTVTEAQATSLLRSTQSLRLEYVRADDDSQTAVLRYLPDRGDDYYVDAKTGNLVNRTELLEGMWSTGAGASNDTAATEETTDSESGLTDAEQAGIQKLEGVLPQEELDAALRKITEFGLSDYTLTSASYALAYADEGEADTEQVNCTLRYSRTISGKTYSRTFFVDAKTGELFWASARTPWEDTRTVSVSQSRAQDLAKAFLEKYYPDQAAHLDLYEASDLTEYSKSFSFQFARKENGYFFPDHYYTVTIDAVTGAVSEFYYDYDEDVTFQAPDGVITAEAAMDAWMATYTVQLQYLLVPQPLSGSDPKVQALKELGFQSFYTVQLGYYLTAEKTCRGIDAKTGQPVYWDNTPVTQAYNDIAGHWAQADIEKLASYGVGFSSESFQPNKALTQFDLLCLLFSIDGYWVEPLNETAAQRDSYYQQAYAAGILTPEERNDNAPVTRNQLVKMILNYGGYGEVARLQGIYTCSYPDKASIAAADRGYAALAQAFGLIRDRYDGAKVATRAVAATMISRMLAR